MHQILFRLGSAPEPLGELTAPRTPAGLGRGAISKRKEGRGGNGREKEKKGRKESKGVKGGRNGGKREGDVEFHRLLLSNFTTVTRDNNMVVRSLSWSLSTTVLIYRLGKKVVLSQRNRPRDAECKFRSIRSAQAVVCFG